MSDTPLIEVQNVSVRFGGVRALSDVSFGVPEGLISAIIGLTEPARRPSSTA
jgi:branched-chain amino acid transport system ATP-binding protein